MDTVTVDTKPWWQSKIIWTQIIGVLAIVGTFFGFNIDAATQVEIVTTLVAVMGTLTTLFRVFGTKTVTPSVAAKLG